MLSPPELLVTCATGSRSASESGVNSSAACVAAMVETTIHNGCRARENLRAAPYLYLLRWNIWCASV